MGKLGGVPNVERGCLLSSSKSILCSNIMKSLQLSGIEPKSAVPYP